MVKRSKREWVVGVSIGFAVVSMVILVYLIRGFEWVELRSYDKRFQLRGPVEIETPIILVMNDEETGNQLQKAPEQVTRADYATAIKQLHDAQAPRHGEQFAANKNRLFPAHYSGAWPRGMRW